MRKNQKNYWVYEKHPVTGLRMEAYWPNISDYFNSHSMRDGNVCVVNDKLYFDYDYDYDYGSCGYICEFYK